MVKQTKLKLTLRLLLVVTVMFVISNAAIIILVHKQLLEEADRNAQYEIDKLLMYTNQQLQMVEAAASNMPREMNPDHFDAERMGRFLVHFMENNPGVEEVVMGLDTERHPGDEEGSWCGQIRDKGGDGTITLEGEELMKLRYHKWFTDVMDGKEGWSRPVISSTGDIIAPFTIAITDREGRQTGAAAVGLSLDSLSQMLKESRPFKNALVTVVDKDNVFICHPDTTMILTTSVDTFVSRTNAKTKDDLHYRIKTKERGFEIYRDGSGHRKLLYSAPIEKTDWAILMQCSESDIFSGTRRILVAMGLAFLFNLIVFGVICWQFFKVSEKNEQQSISNARLESELNTASRIQFSMVPKEFPPFPERKDLDVFASINPAKAVGGDLYDYFIRDEKFFFTIGDVSGKGVPASLLMAITRTLFRVAATQTDDPAEILWGVNNYVARNNAENMFVTMQVGRLDLATGRLVYSNAGHNAPVLLVEKEGGREATFRKMNAGLPVGCMEDFDYVDEEAQLPSGSIVFMYTDGVTEAEDTAHQFFGEERLLDCLKKMPKEATVEDVVKGVEKAVAGFAQGAPQADDLTSLCFCYQKKDNS